MDPCRANQGVACIRALLHPIARPTQHAHFLCHVNPFGTMHTLSDLSLSLLFRFLCDSAYHLLQEHDRHDNAKYNLFDHNLFDDNLFDDNLFDDRHQAQSV